MSIEIRHVMEDCASLKHRLTIPNPKLIDKPFSHTYSNALISREARAFLTFADRTFDENSVSS